MKRLLVALSLALALVWGVAGCGGLFPQPIPSHCHPEPTGGPDGGFVIVCYMNGGITSP
jgi:hypothetical protein